MRNLLIVAHQPSPNTKTVAQRLYQGANSEADGELVVTIKAPFSTKAEDILSADGVILFTTENFGYMSGAMKDLFDRTYYEVIDAKRGMPYALIIRAGKDGTGTKRACEGIIQGLGWKKIAEPLVLQGEFRPGFIDEAHQFAETFAAGLTSGIF
ncbi:hypothetical protein TDB9533_03625 [Thalassocella blandensis]|nr:hypothetical protein TDB9533_03625 [Thalassocella blandensis]